MPPLQRTNLQRLSTLYVLPGAAIGDLVWSRDDTTLAIAQEASITLYRLHATADSAIVLTDHTAYVACLAFSADGQWLASASHDTTVRLWHLPLSPHHAILTGHTNMAVDVAFHPNSTLVVSAGSWDRTVRVWDIATRTSSVQLLGDSDSVGTIAISPNRQWLAAAGNDGIIRLWTYPYNQSPEQLYGHTDTITHLAFAPDSTVLASVSLDATYRRWDMHNRAMPATVIELPDWGLCITYHPSGAFAAIGLFDGRIQLRTIPDGTEIRSLPHHAKGVNALAFNHAGTLLISGNQDHQQGQICVWGLE